MPAFLPSEAQLSGPLVQSWLIDAVAVASESGDTDRVTELCARVGLDRLTRGLTEDAPWAHGLLAYWPAADLAPLRDELERRLFSDDLGRHTTTVAFRLLELADEPSPVLADYAQAALADEASPLSPALAAGVLAMAGRTAPVIEAVRAVLDGIDGDLDNDPDGEELHRVDGLLAGVYGALTDGLPWLRVVLAHDGGDPPDLGDPPAPLSPDAPVDSLLEALSHPLNRMVESARGLLAEVGDDAHAACVFAAAMGEALSPEPNSLAGELWAPFAVAAVLAHHSEPVAETTLTPKPAEDVVETLLADFPASRKGRLELQTWLAEAQAHPDERLVDLLIPELHRGFDEVAELIATHCTLLDLDRPELAAAREQALAASMPLDADDDGSDERTPPPLRLPALCGACGEASMFQPSTVLLNPDEPEATPFVPYLACAGCGESERIGLDWGWQVEVNRLILQATARHKAGEESDPGPLRWAQLFLPREARGLDPRGPAEAVAWLRDAVRERPDDAHARFELACLLDAAEVSEEAESHLRACLSTSPASPEAATVLALIHMERRDVACAYQALADVASRFAQWRWFRPGELTWRREVREAIARHHDECAEILGAPPLAKGALGDGAARSTKIGRNEPCPCGSGKKHKKCCLRASS